LGMLALLCNPPFALEVARRLQGRLRSDTRRVACDFTRAGRRAGFGQKPTFYNRTRIVDNPDRTFGCWLSFNEPRP
jgi:hypothetical protein